jgi:hypothetical protein
MLSGDGAEVAALDFRLRYDPAVFEPVGTEAGPAAAAAGKQVAANTAAPGEHIVVVMGLNQSVMQPGEVATVLLRRVGLPESGITRVEIGELAMSTPDGVEIPSQGGGMEIPLEDAEAPESPEETPPPGTPDPDAPAPGTPTTPAPPDGRPAAAAGAAWVWQPDDDEKRAAAAESAESTAADPAQDTVTGAVGEAALAVLREMAESTAMQDTPGNADVPPAVPGQNKPDDAHIKELETGNPGGDPDTHAALAARPIESTLETDGSATPDKRPATAAPGGIPIPALAGVAAMAAAVLVLVALRGRLFR